jgi:2-deoxy-D-gluconate 3-dehydrogenase
LIDNNLFNFKEKVVLITGGGGSIGSELARAFIECQAKVVITDKSVSEMEKFREELRNKGEIRSFYCDLTKIQSIKRLVKTVLDIYGQIDILINHAGVNIRKPAVDFTEDDWHTIIDTNLKGLFFMAQEVGKVMIKQLRGKIINTSSVSAVRGHPNLAIYAASKGGIQQITKVLANEWAPFNINVNAVGPGYIVTNQTKEYIKDADVLRSLTEKIPMKRLGQAKDVVGAVLFLASEAASYITGHTLFVEGGRLID